MHRAVIGVGYGDETKGALVDYLCTESSPLAVVRFNGGAQAAHNVILEDGTHHTFSQFGSGTLRGVPTILSRFMLVNPLFLYAEAQALLEKTGADPYLNLLVSENALVTTWLHVKMNQWRERKRGDGRHGSVGVGIGETVFYSLHNPEDAIRVKDLADEDLLRKKAQLMVDYYQKQDSPDIDLKEDWEGNLHALYGSASLMNVVSDDYIGGILRAGDVIFEGAQGVLLDEKFGFHPHTTWSKVTRHNLDILLEEADAGPVEVIGTIRTYSTRHGAGPMPSEFAHDDWRLTLPEPHNGTGEFQGGWRAGHLDIPLLKYALEVCEVDYLSVSHMDAPVDGVVTSYPKDFFVPADRPEQIQLTELVTSQIGKGRVQAVSSTQEVVDLIEYHTGKQVKITADGPTAAHRSRRGVN